MLGDCIFYAMLNYSSISGTTDNMKKASLYAKLSFSCFMNILTNIHFACVHQHCQYFPFFMLNVYHMHFCTRYLHCAHPDSHLHFSPSFDLRFFISLCSFFFVLYRYYLCPPESNDYFADGYMVLVWSVVWASCVLF